MEEEQFIRLSSNTLAGVDALYLLQDEHIERLSSTQWARRAVNKVS